MTDIKPARILVADDHTLMREGLRRIIEGAPDMLVAAEATNGQEVIAHVRKGELDLVLLDLSMPGKSGVPLIKQIKEEFPKLPVLVLTMHQEDQYAVRSIQAGASGYLTKESAGTELLNAIRRVAGGRLFISPEVAEQLAMNAMPGSNKELSHKALSDREFEVFRMMVEGISVTDIAEQLNLSAKTVSTHKARILQKMNMQSLAQLVRYAVEHGIAGERSASED
ncbi:response regulator transcription factor [Uliginosibacterium sp. H3]|uniref:Response regulator transcription factor n=1 Tax=Uliginosibacterium silvisoli TaxID=3114758 RepID=A0ABU6JZP3_9RHOO|nr:response regulator transcription factor [Uliginosibacterium sp. H3]